MGSEEVMFVGVIVGVFPKSLSLYSGVGFLPGVDDFLLSLLLTWLGVRCLKRKF